MCRGGGVGAGDELQGMVRLEGLDRLSRFVGPGRSVELKRPSGIGLCRLYACYVWMRVDP